MKREVKTDEEIRLEGAKILVERLGPVEAARFITLMIRSAGDYTEWRRENFHADDIDAHELSRRAMEYVRSRTDAPAAV